MANYKDNRLSKSQRRDIVKSRKFARSLNKDGDTLAFLADKEHRRVKSGR